MKEKKYTLSEIQNINLELKNPCLIFLYGDLGAGKTTLTKHIIAQFLGKYQEITSPTYTYYNKYENALHFDLYRVSDYEYFVSIGGEEILDNNPGLIIIEWPELLEEFYTPDIKIHLQKVSDDDMSRKITIEYCS